MSCKLIVETPDGKESVWPDAFEIWFNVEARIVYPVNRHNQSAWKMIQPGTNITMAAPGVVVFGSAEHFFRRVSEKAVKREERS